MKFYLGTHHPHWLGRLDVPLFVSHRRLRGRKTFPVAQTEWALDSGGFTELSMFGRWVTTPTEYIEHALRYQDEIGCLDWAAPMDWMCEPFMLDKTGLTVKYHQALTVENVLELRAMAPTVPFVPVLQGWVLSDYVSCVERYAEAGIDLTLEKTVGVGSVCRRQSTFEIGAIFRELAGMGIACHGFGVKMEGITKYGKHLASADSMAWSFAARREPPLWGCSHKSCANCPRWALAWRERLLRRCDFVQPELWEAA